MKILTKTQVNSNFPDVLNQVTKGLLAKLAPSHYIYKTIFYQGEQPHDQFEFHLGPPALDKFGEGKLSNELKTTRSFILQTKVIPYPSHSKTGNTDIASPKMEI